jgi:sugar O-acyltransferase (sialic acid O-acetyltransferase NeuD family)
MKQIAVYGAGGFAREVAWLVQSCNVTNTKNYEVVCFIDDDTSKQGTRLNDIPVLNLEQARNHYPHASVVGGIGSPHSREKVMLKAAEMGFTFATIIYPGTIYSLDWNEIGEGTVICAGNILTVNITVGKHVQINLNCTVGHDTILEDYSTLAPGVHVSGWVHMGKRVYVGSGANIINGTETAPLVIADDVVIGAGACVTKSVLEPGTTVVGVPAKPINR